MGENRKGESVLTGEIREIMATHKKPGFTKGTSKTVTITNFVVLGINPGNIVIKDIIVNVKPLHTTDRNVVCPFKE